MAEIEKTFEEAPTMAMPAEVVPKSPGLVIANRYETLSKLGHGAFGIVYQAHDRRLDRQVAIKLLNESCEPESTEAGQFLREAKILASLEHRNIVSVYDADLEGNYLYIVMRLISGQALNNLIRERPLDEVEALRVVGQVAEGLAHAHDRDVLHRDIKPSNLLIGDQGEVFLVDFGLSVARFGSSHSLDHQIAGSLAYMAPESFKGEISKSSDIYALGAVLYESLFREACFRDDNPQVVINKILGEEPPLLNNPPRKLKNSCLYLLRRLLAKQVKQRPETAAQVAHEIDIILATSEHTHTASTLTQENPLKEEPGTHLEPLEQSLADLIHQCDRNHPRRDAIIECFSAFISQSSSLFEILKSTFESCPEDCNCQIETLSLQHLALAARDRLETVNCEEAEADHPTSNSPILAGTVIQLETKILAPARHLLRKIEATKDTSKPSEPAGFFAFEDEAISEEAPQGTAWIDGLFSSKELDQYEAVLTLVGPGRETFVTELACRAEEGRDALLHALWKKADILLLEGRGRARSLFKTSMDLSTNNDLAAKWRQLFALFQNNENGYWDPDVVRNLIEQKETEDRRIFARALSLHPWGEYRKFSLNLLEPHDFWHMIANERTSITSLLEFWIHLQPIVKSDYLKIFFASIQDQLRQPGDAKQLLIKVELVKEFYKINSFHESFFFKTLASLEKAVQEEARRHRYPLGFDKKYAIQMKEFLQGKVTQDQPVHGWGHVPLPVQRILARRGHFQNHFSCHPIDPIALECLKHILAKEDISGFLKLMNINARLLGEIAKDRLHFRDDNVKYLLVANPKTQPFVVAKYVGFLRGDNLRALANSKQCNSFAREHAARLLKKKGQARGNDNARR